MRLYRRIGFRRIQFHFCPKMKANACMKHIENILMYIISWKELKKIATADVKNLQEKVPFDKDKDIGFYEGCESGSYLLKTGDFMVCFPSDAHKVGMMNTVPGMVKKVVVKIRVEE